MDNFKAYNDVYGFLKGDEIIKFTAEVIVSNVHQEIPEGSFVGHIGGDDFVAIIPTTQCDKICQDIISTFDTNVLKFFTPEPTSPAKHLACLRKLKKQKTRTEQITV